MLKSIITAVVIAAVIAGSARCGQPADRRAHAQEPLRPGDQAHRERRELTPRPARRARRAGATQGAQNEARGRSTGCAGCAGRRREPQGVAGPPGLSGYVSGLGGSGSTVSVAPGAQGTAIQPLPVGNLSRSPSAAWGGRRRALRAAHGGRLRLIDDATRAPGYAVTMANTGAVDRTRSHIPAALRSRFLSPLGKNCRK